MKRISTLLLGAGLILMTSSAIATTKTIQDANWTCTTNASSSNVDADKAADTEMSGTARSAAEAYAFAAKNCRDCTKITCESSN